MLMARSHILTDEHRRQIAERFQRGDPLDDIARDVGVSYSTVRDEANRQKLKRPKVKSRSPWFHEGGGLS